MSEAMATDFTLSLYKDAPTQGAAPASLTAATRILYVTEGLCNVETADGAVALAPGSAWCGAGTVEVGARAAGTEILRFELARGAAPGSGTLLAAPIVLDERTDYLIRLDTVELPPGGIAYTHVHQGPGIRCLLAGGFNVRVGGKTTAIAPGEAWFEAGPDPVRAWAPDDRIGRFARVMVLPRALKGKSSIRYVDDADRDKPRLQKYSVLIDRFIDL